MIGKEVISEDFVSISKVKEILSSRAEKIEMGYEQGISLDYTNKFSKMEVEDIEKASEELAEKVPRLKKENIVKILDIVPEDKKDIEVLFSKERLILDDNEINAILEIIAKYNK
ncbi:MAG TPA: RNA polymerase Rpb4 family protein [Methanofastidiosum sp.]|nr:RNA polymerase Rpb4 family protein [Methanofastidiosum sp.]HOG74286.1 RNA polymerase Rpb4 family protein [Methanofastidiosum sp.]HPA49323.1 RNA polymerase Rpb4 family protein [Methanofastidiosum sp.]HQK63028.1 RNA polymerase Rpb4 family protein [Methanofastidiosum sp.]HQM94949.1 RNA polymerase Rpb4 family protein [Methanofastidiosum sp.]